MSTSKQTMTDEYKRISVDVGVLVSNLEASLEFYHDWLGLEVVADLTTSLIGKGRMVQLRHGESLIKLVELDEKPAKQISEELSAALGFRYITLLLTNIKGLMERLEQASVATSIPLTELPNGAMIAMIQDPDGNIVEFVQEARA